MRWSTVSFSSSACRRVADKALLTGWDALEVVLLWRKTEHGIVMLKHVGVQMTLRNLKLVITEATQGGQKVVVEAVVNEAMQLIAAPNEAWKYVHDGKCVRDGTEIVDTDDASDGMDVREEMQRGITKVVEAYRMSNALHQALQHVKVSAALQTCDSLTRFEAR